MHHICRYSYQVMLVCGATDIDQNNHSLVPCYGAISLLGMLQTTPKRLVSANTPLVLPPCVGVPSNDPQTCCTRVGQSVILAGHTEKSWVG